VAFERNCAKVSSAMDKSLEKIQTQPLKPYSRIHQRNCRKRGQKTTQHEQTANIPLTLQGWHPLVDAAESNGADHWSPLIHNLCLWWQGL